MREIMRKLALTVSKSAKMKRWDGKVELSLEDLTASLAKPRTDGNKDGVCLIGGQLAGDQRKAQAVVHCDVLIYDIDGGQTLAEVEKIIDDTGVYGLIYTTFSNLTTKTRIQADHYETWAKRAGEAFPPNLDSMVAYLKSHKKEHIAAAHPEFDPKADLERFYVHDSEGHAYVVHHDPIEKFRVMLPLAERLIMTELGIGSRRSINAYKSIYHGVGQALGLKYDHACEDPSRLHYFPSVRKGEEGNYQARVCGTTAKLLNVKNYPRVEVKDKNTKTTAEGKRVPITTADFRVNDKNGVPIDLLKWEKNNFDFDIEGLLTNCLDDDMLKEDRAGKDGFHITCPFEDNHSSTGGLGTFCANGDGDRSWTIFCSHNSCSDHSKLHYLKEFILQGFVTAEDLGIKTEIAPTVEEISYERAEIERLARELGVDPSTLPDLSQVNVNDGEADAEELLRDFQDRALDGDSIKTAEEVAQESLADLATAYDIKTARTAIGRVRTKGCDVTPTDIVEMLAKSPMTRNRLSPLLKEVARLYDDSYVDLVNELKEIRSDSFILADKLAALYEKRKTGKDLHRELTYIAEYYFLERSTVVREYATYEENIVLQEHGESIKSYFPQLNAQWAKLRSGKSVVFIDMLRSREACAVECLSSDALDLWMRNKNITITLNQGTKNEKHIKKHVYKSWVEDSTLIREYDGITFDPGAPSDNTTGMFNLWSRRIGHNGFPIKPKEGDCSIITDHIRDVWCSGSVEDYNWVITWMADILQNPGRKPTTALVLLGPQGTGKSIIFEYAMGKMLGPYFGTSGSREDVVGRWSGHLIGKLLWLSEETLFAGDKVSMNRLKDRITSTTIDVEKKGIDKFSMPAFTRYVFTSNQIHALHLESDDRRFFVLGTATVHQRDTEYFTRMRNWLDAGGAEKFMHFLVNWNPEDVGLTWGSLLDAPTSELKRRQAEMSYDVSDTFFVELVKYGRITDTPSSIFMDSRVAWPVKVDPVQNGGSDGYILRADTIRSAFETYLKHHMGSSARFERSRFLALFMRYFGFTVEQVSRVQRGEGGPQRIMELPPREVVLRRAAKMNLITEADLNMALDDLNSHLYNDTSDVL